LAKTDSDAQVVKEILDTLEGHPNFVKANRIVDVIHERSRTAANRKMTTRSEPDGTTGLQLADYSS
jgi:hypothetical protein